MNIIDVDDAIISFGSIHAVNGVSLQVESGRTFALLGTNGAGKTTLLEACEGLRPISAGRLRVFGEDPFRNRRKIVSRLGIVLQQAAFPQSLLCREVITMWQRLASRPRQVDELIEVLNLESVAGMPMGKLSGGEKRRVDIACALIGSPELLFLDEPTTGLDPESRKAVWALINELQNAGTTIVLTTHYLEEVEAIAADLAILHRG
ncbi:MAG: ABC transporter ATP-binding protein, partial [Alteromonadaceae bacterium]|nr:ABC transporter ATP-binding protein [Alteromonadaceae bacterium]